MRKARLYFLTVFLLLFTVPWFYFDIEIKSIFGFPAWAFYSLISTFIYAVIIAYFIQKYWYESSS